MIGMTIKVKSNVVKNMGNLIRWVNMELPAVSLDAANYGARYAAGLAPRDSNALYQAIGVNTVKGKGFSVVSRTPKNRDGRYRPYHLWMHDMGKYSTSWMIKSGNPKYMFVTAEKLRNRFPDEVIDRLNKKIKSLK